MSLTTMFSRHPSILMEGALGERLKREYGLQTKGAVDMAGLVYQDAGRQALTTLWCEYIDVARRYGLPFIATTPTRRANRQRVSAAGLDAGLFSENIRLLASIRDASGIEMYAGGMVGSTGNAYTAEGCLPFEAAAELHRWETEHFRAAGADFLFAGLIPTLGEAMGIATAMAETGLPSIISFTIQGDGQLIDGTPIADAIRQVDACVGRPPVCYMTNCVHPTIVAQALSQPFNQVPLVRERFLGLQANTSALPYSALDNAAELHSSPPEELAEGMLRLKTENGFRIFGGCCGTDARHMEAIAKSITQPLG